MENVTERRFREGKGVRYMKGDPNQVRCHGCSKRRLREMRIEQNNPDLTSDEAWPDAQCHKPAVEGTFVCSIHGGDKANIHKHSIGDFMPIDLREKLEIFQSNGYELYNRSSEIAQLKARNAQLYEEMDDLIIGPEGYALISDARKALSKGDVANAAVMLEMALRDNSRDNYIRAEIRENTKIIDKLTITHFNIAKELKLMTPLDQMRSFLDGLYRGAQIIAEEFLLDSNDQEQYMRKFGQLLRSLANVRQGIGMLDDSITK